MGVAAGGGVAVTGVVGTPAGLGVPPAVITEEVFWGVAILTDTGPAAAGTVSAFKTNIIFITPSSAPILHSHLEPGGGSEGYRTSEHLEKIWSEPASKPGYSTIVCFSPIWSLWPYIYNLLLQNQLNLSVNCEMDTALLQHITLVLLGTQFILGDYCLYIYVNAVNAPTSPRCFITITK